MRMRMGSGRDGRTVALLLLAALLVACESGGTPSGSGTTSPTPSSDAPVVRLTDAGAEPKRALRLSVKDGASATATMTMKMGIAIELDGRQLPQTDIPAVSVDIETEVTEIRADGTIVFAFSYDDVSVEARGADRETVRAMQAQLAGIEGLTGSVTITSRGVLVDQTMDVPSDIAPSLSQFIEQLSQQASSLTVPFPEEPVGEGARWTVTMTNTVGGIRNTIVSEYTLRQLRGDDVALAVGYEQSAPEQDASVPGLPAGTTARITNFSVDGSGSIRASLTRITPERSTLSSSGTISMSLQTPEGEQAMRQRISIDLSINGR